MNNVANESDLYEPMRQWLGVYIKEKYQSAEVITVDAHNERLETVLRRFNIVKEEAIGVDIQIDVLGIAIKKSGYSLFFIEAKKTFLTLRDLGQLWAYCKLIDPEEAFLFSSKGFGILAKILKVLAREDLLDFGTGKKIKKMRVAVWNTGTNSPNFQTMIPKI